jgi:hypothetical protein
MNFMSNLFIRIYSGGGVTFMELCGGGGGAEAIKV